MRSKNCPLRNGTFEKFQDTLVQQREQRLSEPFRPVVAIVVKRFEPMHQVLIIGGCLPDQFFPAAEKRLTFCGGRVFVGCGVDVIGQRDPFALEF